MPPEKAFAVPAVIAKAAGSLKGGTNWRFACRLLTSRLSRRKGHQKKTYKNAGRNITRRQFTLGGGFKHFLFSPLFGEDSHFD